MWPWMRAERRVDALERRLKELEGEREELEHVRRIATNTIRSLRKHAAHELAASQADDQAGGRGQDRAAEINEQILARRRSRGLLRQG
jgi:hypothetical protein